MIRKEANNGVSPDDVTYHAEIGRRGIEQDVYFGDWRYLNWRFRDMSCIVEISC